MLVQESGTVREYQRARSRNSSSCALRGLMCVSHSCSMGWDLFQVTQKGGKRAVPAGEMRSRTHVEPCPWCLSGALSAPCVGAHWPCLPALVLVSSYLLLVHLPLALMAKLLTATLRQAGPKMRIRTLLMLTLTVTLAKKPSALAWASVLSPLAIEHSSTWSSWKRQSRWAPGSDLPGGGWAACECCAGLRRCE